MNDFFRFKFLKRVNTNLPNDILHEINMFINICDGLIGFFPLQEKRFIPIGFNGIYKDNLTLFAMCISEKPDCDGVFYVHFYGKNDKGYRIAINSENELFKYVNQLSEEYCTNGFISISNDMKYFDDEI